MYGESPRQVDLNISHYGKSRAKNSKGLVVVQAYYLAIQRSNTKIECLRKRGNGAERPIFATRHVESPNSLICIHITQIKKLGVKISIYAQERK